MRGDPAERVAALIAPVVTGRGMDLEEVRVTVAGRRRLLRIVVDRDGGVSLEDTASLSRDLSTVLDAADVMGDAPYTLEVSSPGVSRPLTQPRHWRRAAGRMVRVPVRSDGSVHGRVIAADDTQVTLDVDGRPRRFDYTDLGPGEVQVEFDPAPAVHRRPGAETRGRTGSGVGGPGAKPDGH